MLCRICGRPPVVAAQRSGDVGPMSYAGPPVRTTPTPFPVPPAQGTPWEAPAGVRPDLVDAARRYFDQLGMPDPRGLPLYRVTLNVGYIDTGQAIRVNTAGWLLPDPPVDGRRFVIAPNGFLYAADSVQERLEVADYARALESPDEAQPSLRWHIMFSTGSEEHFMRCRTEGTRSLLLLCAGYSPRQSSMASWREGETDSCGDADRRWGQETSDPMATLWRWHRAVGASRRGDDTLALHDLHILHAGLLGVLNTQPSLDQQWLADVASLLNEEVRRARESRDSTPSGAPAGDPVGARVAELIHGLEEVDGVFNGRSLCATGSLVRHADGRRRGSGEVGRGESPERESRGLWCTSMKPPYSISSRSRLVPSGHELPSGRFGVNHCVGRWFRLGALGARA